MTKQECFAVKSFANDLNITSWTVETSEGHVVYLDSNPVRFQYYSNALSYLCASFQRDTRSSEINGSKPVNQKASSIATFIEPLPATPSKVVRVACFRDE